MTLRRFQYSLRGLMAVAWLAVCAAASASEYHGQVLFSGQPVPGVTVTATHGDKKVSVVTDTLGVYSFPDLSDGPWTIEVGMTLFAPIKQDVVVAPAMPSINFDLKLLPSEEILSKTHELKLEAPVAAPVVAAVTPKPTGKGDAKKGTNTTAAPAADAPKAEEPQDRSADALLINGSQNNAASSAFTMAPAFGNRRNGNKGLYTGGVGLVFENSALNARSYSLSGLETPQLSYNRITGVATLGGPLNIPHILRRGPNFFLAYQWTRSNDATTLSGIVPTAAQRAMPITSAAAAALLQLYPLPNVTGTSRYNYQVPQLNGTHQDSFQSRLDKTIGQRNQVYGGISFQSTRADTSNLFSFRDASATLGLTSNVNWVHRFHHGFVSTAGFRFSRLRSQIDPFFENRVNVAGNAGVVGNDQSAVNWGPPTLNFSSGINSLSDAQYAFNRNRTDAASSSTSWNHGRHYVTFGGDFRRQEFNYRQQQDPRGTFTFTGTSDFANFLAGNPDTVSINYGNADKYLRQSVYDLFVTDDWRLRPDLTINVGVRWEYGAPITELKGRIANLDIAPGFTAAVPVLGNAPNGSLTGNGYPSSLVRPDKNGVEPRIGMSWRPIPGSSLVVRAGYGVYQDTSVYAASALALAQQPPLATKAFTLDRGTCGQTLSSGFNCASRSTFAIDPNFRVGYAQTWQIAAQRDLPAALQMTVTYLGIKGTRGVQEFLPNTYPVGGANPCALCPVGFTYRTSNGNSTRESGSAQLRRRLRSGFTATVQYTYSKSIDNDSQLGGQGPIAPGATAVTAGASTIAQNWLDLRAERGLSSFDQRHLVTATLQYTSGQGLGGGTLMGGWRGRAIKEWTVLNTFNAGTGLPETPIYYAIVPGTGVTGTIRPNLTGASITAAPAGYFVNPAAFSAPAAGQWGNARKNSITGPSQFTWNASLSRTFRLDTKLNLDVRIDATNVLNHVVYSGWNTTINSLQFGLPVAANPMRSLQANARVRF